MLLVTIALPSWLELPTISESLLGILLVFAVYKAVRSGVRESFEKALGRILDRRKLNTVLDLALARLADHPPEGGRGQIPPPQENHSKLAKEIRAALSVAGEGHPDGAIEKLEQLRKQNAKSTAVLWSLADVHLKVQHYHQAEVLLQEAIKIEPDDPALHHNLGVAQFRQEKWEAALHSFQTAIGRDSTNPGTQLFAGFSLWKLDRLADAIELTREGLRKARLNSDRSAQARALNNLAYFLWDVADRKARETGDTLPKPDGSLAEAQALHEEAVALRGLTPADLDTRACLRLWAGDQAGALADVEAAIRQGGVNRTRMEHYKRLQPE